MLKISGPVSKNCLELTVIKLCAWNEKRKNYMDLQIISEASKMICNVNKNFKYY